MKTTTPITGKRTPVSKERSAKERGMSFYKGREIYRTAKARAKGHGYAVDRLLLVNRISCPECHCMHTVMQQRDGTLSILCPAIQDALHKEGTVYTIEERDLAMYDKRIIAYHTVDLYDPNGVLERRVKEYVPIDELGYPVPGVARVDSTPSTAEE